MFRFIGSNEYHFLPLDGFRGEYLVSNELKDEFNLIVETEEDIALGIYESSLKDFCSKYEKFLIPKDKVCLYDPQGNIRYIPIEEIGSGTPFFDINEKFCENRLMTLFSLRQTTGITQIVQNLVILDYINSPRFEEEKKNFTTSGFQLLEIEEDFLTIALENFLVGSLEFFRKNFRIIPKEYLISYSLQKYEGVMFYNAIGYHRPELRNRIFNLFDFSEIPEDIITDGVKLGDAFFNKVGEDNQIKILQRGLYCGYPRINAEKLKIFFTETYAPKVFRYLLENYFFERSIFFGDLIGILSLSSKEKSIISTMRGWLRDFALENPKKVETLNSKQQTRLMWIIKIYPLQWLHPETVDKLMKNQVQENKIYLLPTNLDMKAWDIVKSCPTFNRLFKDVEKCEFL